MGPMTFQSFLPRGGLAATDVPLVKFVNYGHLSIVPDEGDDRGRSGNISERKITEDLDAICEPPTDPRSCPIACWTMHCRRGSQPLVSHGRLLRWGLSPHPKLLGIRSDLSGTN